MAKVRKFSKPKSTAVKVSNKNYNRKVKSGKIKPNTRWNFKGKNSSKVNQSRPTSRYTDADSDGEGINVQDILEDESGQIDKFEVDMQLNRKHKRETLEAYEQHPRDSFSLSKRVKYLLPLKDKHGLIPQQIEILEDEVCENVTFPVEHFLEGIVPLKKPESFVDLCALREQKLCESKESIGLLSISIVENPEENIRKVKEILLFLDENDPHIYLSVRRMACLSLVEVFRDILPTYRVRDVSTEEKNRRLKKETRQLKEFEESLLRYYKQFLGKLEKMMEFLNSAKRKKGTELGSQAKVKAKHAAAILALKCFSELLIAHPHFNYRANILKFIVERMAHTDQEISNICCDTMIKVFKADKVGEISLEGIKEIKKLVKSRNYNVPCQVLLTFLLLNVKEAERKDEPHKKDLNKANQKSQLLSRKEKKRQKKLKEVEHELLETQAEESKQKKSKFHTEILNQVFLIYFRILKGDSTQAVLTPVLEGLSKFSHLINIDFFDDLIVVLQNLIQSGNLGYRDILHCLKTVFTILSGQGESLNIDPQAFYVHLYNCLLQVDPFLSDEDIVLYLQCLDLMIMQRRKKITLQRVLAFLKRILTLSMSQKRHITLAFLALVRQYFLNFKRSDILLDPENAGSGQYKPETEDPEHASGNSAVLWELHQLANDHNPVVARYAKHLLLQCPRQGPGQLHPYLALKSPLEIMKLFSENKIGNVKQIHVHQKLDCVTVKKLHSCVTDPLSVMSQAVNFLVGL